MTYRAHLTRISENVKTGPMPVSTTESTTCNPNCGEFDTCYAKFGPLGRHWGMVSDGRRGTDWATFCEQVRSLPRKALWRHNQAGDLPGNGKVIDTQAMDLLVLSNKGRRGFTYTHYPMDRLSNIEAVEKANRNGFTVNVSCDTLTMSDSLIDVVDAPQSVVLHSGETRKSLQTPQGRKVVVCPATCRDDVTCASCQICYECSSSRAVIGFPAHGTKKRIIDIRLEKAA